MQKPNKEWLVRTRTREIFGPFTQHELIEQLHKGLFTVDDEIAPSMGHFFSAQALNNRDADEVTHTSTRSQTFSKSREPRPYEDLTPTPEVGQPAPSGSDQKNAQAPKPRASGPGLKLKMPAPGFGPSLFITLIIVGIFGLLASLKHPKKASVSAGSEKAGVISSDGESAFVKKIYTSIRLGDTQTALKQLVQYHERGPAKGDVEYLIPYAALLITEKESPGRAKKFLEHVLDVATNNQLKAKAHLWLGYLMLSEDEGDLGESHFREALELNPHDPAARFNLGRAYLKQEKYAQALEYLQLAELESPDLWLIHIYKGRAKVSLGNMEEARQAFKMAVQNAPDRWIGYVYYSLFLMGMREGEAAQNILKKMLTRDPDYETRTPVPFGFFQEKINYGEYLDAFTHVMEHASGNEREVGKLYINYLSNGPGGVEAKRLEGNPDKAGLFTKVLALKIVLDRDATPEELKTTMARLPANLTPFGYFAYVLRAEARTKLGQFDEAQADLHKALVLEPKAAVTHWELAKLLKRLQRTPEAQGEIRHLLTYHPDYIPAIVASEKF